MQLRTMFPNDELAFRCFRSDAKKYSTEWWDHVERSTVGNGDPKDALVLKLIEAYEETEEGYQELKDELDRVM